MNITFLEARVPLTKKFTSTTKEPYPSAFEFKSHSYTVKSLAHFHQLIATHSALGHCLLKGEIEKQLMWESRAGSTNPHKSTRFLCLDIDGLSSITNIDDFMNKIGLGHVSYIVQWSASYLIRDNTIRAHVFVFLTHDVSATALKSWLRQLNFQHFSSDLALTKTNVALRWGLDITTCQNDKLIYITPPQCDPATLDPFINGVITAPRIQLVSKQTDFFDFSTVTVQTAEQLKSTEEAEINRLRKAANLTERKANQFKFKDFKGESYLPNPDQATVTSIKEERGFVYLNLNGGDSWGYFHPVDNPTFISNFKGEPTYKTSELLPDYWNQLQTAKRQAKSQANAGKLFLAFRDFRSAEYFNGWYDQSTDEITLYTAKSERQLEDFLINYGQPVPVAVPIWSIKYDPTGAALDLTARTVNVFKPSHYMRWSKAQPTTAVPKPTPTIDYVISHVFGKDMVDHFFNWLAYCFQYRTAPCTAWIASGTQGTGKGVLVNQVLTPLFGQTNVVQKRMEELEDKFNAHLENALLCVIDEAQISDSGREKMIMANLKNQITEPVISIRRMRQSAYEVPNRVGFIFNSNKPDPVVVESGDRRFNVGEYQPNKIAIDDAQIQLIINELPDFALRLHQHKVDPVAVRTPKMTEAKQQMILVSRSSADAVADAIRTGDLSILWDALPTGDVTALDPSMVMKLQPYKQLIYELVQSRRDRLTREELFVLFNYNVGNIPASPWKLTVYLKHHNLQIEPVRLSPTKVVRGLHVTWTNSEDWFSDRLSEIKAENEPRLKTVPKTVEHPSNIQTGS